MSSPDDDRRFAPPDLDPTGMPKSTLAPPLQARLRAAQIVHGAMAAGVGVFAGVALVLGPTGIGAVHAPFALGPLAWVLPAVLLAGGALAARIIRARGVVAAHANRAEGPQRFSQAMILSAAVVEGPGVLAAVLALVSGEPLALLVSAVAVVVLVRGLPTELEMRRFVG